jgi:hypothetical protein
MTRSLPCDFCDDCRMQQKQQLELPESEAEQHLPGQAVRTVQHSTNHTCLTTPLWLSWARTPCWHGSLRLFASVVSTIHYRLAALASGRKSESKESPCLDRQQFPMDDISAAELKKGSIENKIRVAGLTWNQGLGEEAKRGHFSHCFSLTKGFRNCFFYNYRYKNLYLNVWKYLKRIDITVQHFLLFKSKINV